MRTEGGKKGSATLNKDRTYDYGPMQINSIWLKQLRFYGYTAEILQNKPCLNVQVGAWILGKAIASENKLWQGVGNYHSHATALNRRYQQKLMARYQLISSYLSSP